MKKCVRYLRYSSTGQSKCSIELQAMNTLSWCTYNNTEVLETFEDKGKSATNFDRPNFKELELFIKKWHKTVDYVLVNSFDRFSRDAGEAMMKIKYYCTKYNIRIASAGENCIYDPEDVSSFWNVALAFIRAEDEIMRHKKRVNGGIYANMYAWCTQKMEQNPQKKDHYQQRMNFYEKLYLQVNTFLINF